MDMTRPLWECHLIEGLEDNRFALYFKAHHCAVDGMAAMRMVRSWLSEDPGNPHGPAIQIPPAPEPEAPEPELSRMARLKKPVNFAGKQIRSLGELAKMLRKMSEKGQEGGTRAALATPKSLFNVRITQQRRLGTQILDLVRIKAISKETGTTVNDVCLAICGGAIRRYLLEQDALPEKSLSASVPIGLARSDGKVGNAVAGFVCPMGTDEEIPQRRLERIHEVTTRSKEQLLSMSPTALMQFAMMGLSPLILGQMTGTLSKIPPFFNVTVSNVVASKVPLYLRGAELEAMYPMSILFDGYALNITLVGYQDRIAIGFTGCRDAIPSLQRLAVYTTDALAEIEEAYGLNQKKKKKSKK